MRVAYVCADPGVPVFGQKGCSIHVQEVISALVGQGVQVELFASRLGGKKPEGMASVPVHQLTALPKGELEVREGAALAANDELGAMLLREGPFDMVYERYSLWSYAGMAYAQGLGIPGVLEVNAPLIEEQAQHRGLLNREAAEEVASRVFTSASVLIAVSQGVADYLGLFAGVAERTHVIPNAVNPDRFVFDRPARKPSDTLTIGFVGTLKPWHGLSGLVQAFVALPQSSQARLLIIGDGPERPALEATIEAQGIKHLVQFTGAVSPDEIPHYLSVMDIAVAPYPNLSDFYFSPLKVYEYMAAGLPVVASRIGQLSELIEDGQDGLLYPAGDEAALALTIQRLLSDASLRHHLGQAARHKILLHHTWAGVAKRILELAQASRSLEHA